jgi:hypothetical protein
MNQHLLRSIAFQRFVGTTPTSFQCNSTASTKPTHKASRTRTRLMAASEHRHLLGHRDLTPPQIFLVFPRLFDLKSNRCWQSSFPLLEQDLGHHSLVLVIEQMAMK